MSELTTKARILATAEGIVDESGIPGLRIDAVAHQAAINKRMIYHYFGSRDGLIRCVLQRQLQMILAATTVSDILKVLMQRAAGQIDMAAAAVDVDPPVAANLPRAFRILWQHILTEGGIVRSEYSLSESEQRQVAEEIMRQLLPGMFLLPPKPVYRMQSASRS